VNSGFAIRKLARVTVIILLQKPAAREASEDTPPGPPCPHDS
jgi:hypothetical protein